MDGQRKSGEFVLSAGSHDYDNDDKICIEYQGYKKCISSLTNIEYIV